MYIINIITPILIPNINGSLLDVVDGPDIGGVEGGGGGPQCSALQKPSMSLLVLFRLAQPPTNQSMYALPHSVFDAHSGGIIEHPSEDVNVSGDFLWLVGSVHPIYEHQFSSLEQSLRTLAKLLSSIIHTSS